MAKRTALYAKHLEANAKMVDFAGWDMPIHYGSQIQEHNAVREQAGMFDVSHMTIVDVNGSDATDYLQKLLANDVARLQEKGKALYSAMLNQDGGVIDDLSYTRPTTATVWWSTRPLAPKIWSGWNATCADSTT